MRIAWFARAGDVTAGALAALATEHDVELWVPEPAGPAGPPDVPVVRFVLRPLAMTRLHLFDGIVYDGPSDRAIMAVARARPGVVLDRDTAARAPAQTARRLAAALARAAAQAPLLALGDRVGAALAVLPDDEGDAAARAAADVIAQLLSAVE